MRSCSRKVPQTPRRAKKAPGSPRDPREHPQCANEFTIQLETTSSGHSRARACRFYLLFHFFFVYTNECAVSFLSHRPMRTSEPFTAPALKCRPYMQIRCTKPELATVYSSFYRLCMCLEPHETRTLHGDVTPGRLSWQRETS